MKSHRKHCRVTHSLGFPVKSYVDFNLSNGNRRFTIKSSGEKVSLAETRRTLTARDPGEAQRSRVHPLDLHPGPSSSETCALGTYLMVSSFSLSSCKVAKYLRTTRTVLGARSPDPSSGHGWGGRAPRAQLASGSSGCPDMGQVPCRWAMPSDHRGGDGGEGRCHLQAWAWPAAALVRLWSPQDGARRTEPPDCSWAPSSSAGLRLGEKTDPPLISLLSLTTTAPRRLAEWATKGCSRGGGTAALTNGWAGLLMALWWLSPGNRVAVRWLKNTTGHVLRAVHGPLLHYHNAWQMPTWDRGHLELPRTLSDLWKRRPQLSHSVNICRGLGLYHPTPGGQEGGGCCKCHGPGKGCFSPTSSASRPPPRQGLAPGMRSTLVLGPVFSCAHTSRQIEHTLKAQTVNLCAQETESRAGRAISIYHLLQRRGCGSLQRVI